jgi:heme/copper-type cytochrome/quinol oxidase subunit 2
MAIAAIPDAIRRLGGSPRVRKGAFWLVVVVGGGLQYARNHTNHPSTLLIVWGWISGVAFVVVIAGLLYYAAMAVRERFRRRQHGGG